jgi:DinB superfamily
MPPADVSAHLQRLRTTGRDLVSLVVSAEPAALRREPAPDEWSAATVVNHLADAELVYSVRLRLIVAEDRPILTAFDEEAWADRFGELDDDPKDSLGRFRALRESNLRLLEALVDGEWERTGVHQQKGIVSVAAIVKLLAEHDRTHLDQIRRALT